MRNYFKKTAGFSLVEIIVSAVLLALIAAGIFSITLSSQKLISRSHRRHFANEVAKAVLENLRPYLGADNWYNASSPIHPLYLGSSGVWSGWHNLTNNNTLGMKELFETSEFATRYRGKWKYRIINATSPYEYRQFEVEVDWTEPTQ